MQNAFYWQCRTAPFAAATPAAEPTSGGAAPVPTATAGAGGATSAPTSLLMTGAPAAASTATTPAPSFIDATGLVG